MKNIILPGIATLIGTLLLLAFLIDSRSDAELIKSELLENVQPGMNKGSLLEFMLTRYDSEPHEHMSTDTSIVFTVVNSRLLSFDEVVLLTCKMRNDEVLSRRVDSFIDGP